MEGSVRGLADIALQRAEQGVNEAADLLFVSPDLLAVGRPESEQADRTDDAAPAERIKRGPLLPKEETEGSQRKEEDKNQEFFRASRAMQIPPRMGMAQSTRRRVIGSASRMTASTAVIRGTLSCILDEPTRL